MKQLILITVLLVTALAKLVAQEKNTIEIKDIYCKTTPAEENQFKIVANEALDIKLKFDLKKEEQLNVLIFNKLNKIVFSRELFKEGENKFAFTIEENEQYTVKLITKSKASMLICLTEY
jgi:hypothetical protein